jgi:hypothetical protein
MLGRPDGPDGANTLSHGSLVSQSGLKAFSAKDWLFVVLRKSVEIAHGGPSPGSVLDQKSFRRDSTGGCCCDVASRLSKVILRRISSNELFLGIGLCRVDAKCQKLGMVPL